jgi:hypothetical protein
MKLNTERPEATAIDGKVYVFVGGIYQAMTVHAGETFYAKLGEAIAKAKEGTTIICGCAGEIHFACRASEEPKA